MRSRRLAAALALVALPSVARPVLPADALLLERILAVVEGRPVLLSEVRLVQALRSLPERAALDALIDERLMLREAGRLSRSAVSDEEEERALARLRETNPAARAAPEAELRRLVRRQTAILKYIDFRFRPQVSVAEEAAAPEVRARLLQDALDRRIEAWVAELRQAADVRYNDAEAARRP